MPFTLPTRKIGNTDVTAIGYGTMGISINYGAPLSDEEAFQVSQSFVEIFTPRTRKPWRSWTRSMSLVAPTGIPLAYTAARRISLESGIF